MFRTDKCPFCGSLKVLAGQVISSEGACGFKPADTKTGLVLTLRHPFAFTFGPDAHYCVACCMVWSKADPRDAAEFLERFATDELKARLAAIDAVNADRSKDPQ